MRWLSVESKEDGIRPSDMDQLVPGKAYAIGLQQRIWRWMYVYEMPGSLDQVARRRLLGELRLAKWHEGCRAYFEAVE